MVIHGTTVATNTLAPLGQSSVGIMAKKEEEQGQFLPQRQESSRYHSPMAAVSWLEV